MHLYRKYLHKLQGKKTPPNRLLGFLQLALTLGQARGVYFVKKLQENQHSLASRRRLILNQ
jgi:hypothetical protein